MKKFRKVIRWALVCLLLVAAMTLQAFATGHDTVSMPEEVKTLDTFIPGSNVDKYGTATLGAMPCVGNAKVLVFYTTFGNAEVPSYGTKASQIKELFFGYKNSLRSYYQTSSYGKLDITGTVYEYTTLRVPMITAGFPRCWMKFSTITATASTGRSMMVTVMVTSMAFI